MLKKYLPTNLTNSYPLAHTELKQFISFGSHRSWIFFLLNSLINPTEKQVFSKAHLRFALLLIYKYTIVRFGPEIGTSSPHFGSLPFPNWTLYSMNMTINENMKVKKINFNSDHAFKGMEKIKS